MENRIYDELNPGAKALLDSFLDERKQKIYDYIAEKALKENRHISELSAKDIFEIQQALDETNELDRKKRKRLLLLSMVSIMGGIYALVGSLILYMRFDSIYSRQLFLLMIVMGVTLTVLTSLTILFREVSKRPKDLLLFEKRHENENLYNEIINIWRTIESLALKSLESESSQIVSPAKNLNWLMSTDKLSKDDHLVLKKIINIRNIVVHKGPNSDLTRAELKQLVNRSNIIIEKLSS